MNLPSANPSTPPRPAPQRRGFVFIMILIVVFAAAAMVTWSINRATTEGLIVEKRLQAYARHHESLGVRDLVLVWLTREASGTNLPELAKSGAVAYRVVLPDQVVVLVRIRDGQGTIRCTVDADDPPEVTQRLIDVLQWLPKDRPDLLRRYGAMQVSVAGAPPEVLTALARGNETILKALQRIKERPTVERSNFFQELQQDGIEVEDVQALADMIVFDQNRMWRLDVEVIDPRSVRRYVGLAQTDRNLPQMLEWTEVLGQPEGELDEVAAQEAGRRAR